MNLLLALFLIVFEACYEGLKTAGHHVASEMVELVYLIVLTLVAFSWLNRKHIKEVYLPYFYKILIGYFLLRFSLFDLVWNLSAGQSWDFYGTTKEGTMRVYDNVMSDLGGFGWFLKFCASIWGIAWLTKWGNK